MGSGWQPISTAPKDGEVVLGVWFDEGENREAVLWDAGWESAIDGTRRVEPDGWRPLGGGS